MQFDWVTEYLFLLSGPEQGRSSLQRLIIVDFTLLYQFLSSLPLQLCFLPCKKFYALITALLDDFPLFLLTRPIPVISFIPWDGKASVQVVFRLVQMSTPVAIIIWSFVKDFLLVWRLGVIHWWGLLMRVYQWFEVNRKWLIGLALQSLWLLFPGCKAVDMARYSSHRLVKVEELLGYLAVFIHYTWLGHHKVAEEVFWRYWVNRWLVLGH